MGDYLIGGTTINSPHSQPCLLDGVSYGGIQEQICKEPGSAVEALQIITKIAGFQLKLKVYGTSEFGLPVNDSSWNGLVGKLINRSIEIIPPMLYFNEQRNTAIEMILNVHLRESWSIALINMPLEFCKQTLFHYVLSSWSFWIVVLFYCSFVSLFTFSDYLTRNKFKNDVTVGINDYSKSSQIISSKSLSINNTIGYLYSILFLKRYGRLFGGSKIKIALITEWAFFVIIGTTVIKSFLFKTLIPCVSKDFTFKYSKDIVNFVQKRGFQIGYAYSCSDSTPNAYEEMKQFEVGRLLHSLKDQLLNFCDESKMMEYWLKTEGFVAVDVDDILFPLLFKWKHKINAVAVQLEQQPLISAMGMPKGILRKKRNRIVEAALRFEAFGYKIYLSQKYKMIGLDQFRKITAKNIKFESRRTNVFGLAQTMLQTFIIQLMSSLFIFVLELAIS